MEGPKKITGSEVKKINPISDSELIDLYLKEKNESSFKILYERYWPDVFRIVRRFGIDEHSAEDVCQETFYKVSRGLHQLEDREKFRNWLFKAAINNAMMWFRRNRNRKMIDSIYMTGEDGVSESLHTKIQDKELPIDDMVHFSEFENTVKKCLKKLPEGYQKVLDLTIFQGKNDEEISKILGVEIGTVKSQRSKARQALMNLMYDYLSEVIENSPKS